MTPKLALSLAAVLLLPLSLLAEDRVVRDRNGLNTAIPNAKPGDRILIAPGDYSGNFFFRDIRGTAEKPITIMAQEPTKPPHLRGQSLCLQFSGTSHLVLSNLELSGAQVNGLVIDDGGKADNPATGIVLRNIIVHSIGRADGNNDGIKLSGLDGFRLENCKVDRWGRGGSGIDMVGCHRGLILDSTFANGGANAIQTKGGSSDITIRNCKFLDYGARGVNIGGSTGDPYFRPPLKSMPAERKFEAKNIRVEGNLFIGGEAPVAFVGVDGAVVRFNTIYNPARHALRILQEKTDPGFVPSRDGQFQDNIIVFRSERWSEGGVNIGPDTAPKTFRFARNVWFCEDRPDRSTPNLPTPGRDEIVGKDPQFVDAAKKDFRLKDGSPAAGRGVFAMPQEK